MKMKMWGHSCCCPSQAAWKCLNIHVTFLWLFNFSLHTTVVQHSPITWPWCFCSLKRKRLLLVQNEWGHPCWVPVGGLNCAVIDHKSRQLIIKQKGDLFLRCHGNTSAFFIAACLHLVQYKHLSHGEFPLQQINMCKCTNVPEFKHF